MTGGEGGVVLKQMKALNRLLLSKILQAMSQNLIRYRTYSGTAIVDFNYEYLGETGMF